MTWVDRLADELGTVDNRDVYQHYRDLYGRAATRHFAQDMGVSGRTARRAFSGAPGVRQFTKTTDFAEAKAAVISARIDEEGLGVVDPGRVEVFYDGASAGYRTIPPQDLAGHPNTPRIGAALIAGDRDRAAELINSAVMDLYGAPMLSLTQ